MIKRIAAGIMPRLLQKVPKNKKWLYPFWLAGQLDLTEEEYFSPSLPEAFDGLNLAFASDIHFGPLFHREEADRLIRMLLSIQADLILLGGDYGNELSNSIAFFKHIPAFSPVTPVLAVLGNHDYGKPGESLKPLFDAMREKNVIPLVNKAHSLIRGNKQLAILGPDDIKCGKPDFEPLKEAAEAADFSVFIPHSPDIIPLAQEAELPFDLAICGHTHGGQIVFFGRSPHASSIYGDRFRTGWIRENNQDILVSNGVGTSILPMRIGTRPQIHRITLRREV